MENLVECDWLLENLNNKNVLVLDCTFKLSTEDHFQEYKADHIPGSISADLEQSGRKSETVRRDLLELAEFQDWARQLGVSRSSHVICLDRTPEYLGMFFACRFWWLFKVYGHENVSVLNGGLLRWKQLGFPMTSDLSPKPDPGDFLAHWERKADFFASYEDFLNARQNPELVLLDARASEAFSGKERGPFPEGVKGGHVTGSQNSPVTEFLDFPSSKLKSVEEIRKILAGKNVPGPETKILTYCNTGMKAAGLNLILAIAGYQGKMFNGSLFEVSRRNPELIHAVGF